jgi:hypothetical protein
MASRAAAKTPNQPRGPRSDDRDPEARALWRNPVFRALLDEARGGKPEESIPAEELDRRRPLTDADKAIADEYLAAFDRLEEAQDAEVTGEQARVLNVVLIGARYLRGERTLAGWAEYTGLAEEEIRAAAVVLEALGLKAAEPGDKTG